MTELLEGIDLGDIKTVDGECPFHEKEHVCEDAKNELEGDATVLGKSLEDGSDDTSTVVRTKPPDIGYRYELHQEPDPDERKEDDREVQLVKGNDDTWYPVGFQAHHLIPAQESLARAKRLLSYIRRGDRACCNLGYDVNGNQNGVWLPGKHPVDGNGLDLWKGRTKKGPDKEGTGRKTVTRGRGKHAWSYVELKGRRAGKPGSFENSNMRWLYVQASMNFLGKRQFHDRHPTYSKAVLDHLNAVAAVLDRFAGSAKEAAQCPECRKVEKGKRKPPVALLGALNRLSEHYLGKVNGFTEHPVFYTSSWCDPARKSDSWKKPPLRVSKPKARG